MSQNMLDEFGKILIGKVRDKVIIDWKMILDGKMKGSSAAHVRDLLSEFSIEQVDILEKLIPQVVDTTLHHLLWTLDQLDRLKILLSDADGTTCNIKLFFYSDQVVIARKPAWMLDRFFKWSKM